MRLAYLEEVEACCVPVARVNGTVPGIIAYSFKIREEKSRDPSNDPLPVCQRSGKFQVVRTFHDAMCCYESALRR